MPTAPPGVSPEERLVASLSNDSGAGHMLAASDRPLLSLFGPTSARKLRPLSEAVHTLDTRDLGAGEDITALTPELVCETFEQVYGAGGAPC